MVAHASDVPGEAELEVIPDPLQANILVNHISVATRGPVKLRLPPGLYSVALEREGFRSAEGAVTLVGGDHAALAGTLTETKTHGWNGLGHAFVVLGVLSEAVAIAAHVEANRKIAEAVTSTTGPPRKPGVKLGPSQPSHWPPRAT